MRYILQDGIIIPYEYRDMEKLFRYLKSDHCLRTYYQEWDLTYTEYGGGYIYGYTLLESGTLLLFTTKKMNNRAFKEAVKIIDENKMKVKKGVRVGVTRGKNRISWLPCLWIIVITPNFYILPEKWKYIPYPVHRQRGKKRY